MDTSTIKKAIPAAEKQGLLKPCKKPNICFIPSLNQANFLLYLIERSEENGLSAAQIAQRSGLHPTTCKCYIREFVKLKIVVKEQFGRSQAVWYLLENKK